MITTATTERYAEATATTEADLESIAEADIATATEELTEAGATEEEIAEVVEEITTALEEDETIVESVATVETTVSITLDELITDDNSISVIEEVIEGL